LATHLKELYFEFPIECIRNFLITRPEIPAISIAELDKFIHFPYLPWMILIFSEAESRIILIAQPAQNQALAYWVVNPSNGAERHLTGDKFLHCGVQQQQEVQ
jgi:hypothetical protein